RAHQNHELTVGTDANIDIPDREFGNADDGVLDGHHMAEAFRYILEDLLGHSRFPFPTPQQVTDATAPPKRTVTGFRGSSVAAGWISCPARIFLQRDLRGKGPQKLYRWAKSHRRPQLTRLRTSAPQIPAQTPVTVKPATNQEVIQRTRPLTTKVKSPRVARLRGRVKRSRM